MKAGSTFVREVCMFDKYTSYLHLLLFMQSMFIIAMTRPTAYEFLLFRFVKATVLVLNNSWIWASKIPVSQLAGPGSARQFSVFHLFFELTPNHVSRYTPVSVLLKTTHSAG